MTGAKVLRIFGAAAGLIAAVLMFGSEILRDVEVPAVSPSSNIAAGIIDAQRSIFMGTYLLMVGVFFFIFFVGYLRGRSSPRHEEVGWLPNTAFAGGLVAAATLLLSAHFDQSLTILSGYGAETQVAKSLYLLKWNWYLLVEAIPIAVFIGANSLHGLLREEWAWWIIWPGLAISLLLVLPYVTGSGVMLSYIWVGALSIHQLIVERKDRSREDEVLS